MFLRIKLGWQIAGILMAAASLAASGCGKHSSAEEALGVALKDAGQTKVAVYPLSGTVRIDGKVPEYDHRRPIFVVITDPQNPKQTDYVECDHQGRFAFHTYAESDGYRPGTYVFAFVQLMKSRHRTLGPDRLGNLYNDPERNAQKQGFKIEHKAPGKTDYVFDLMVQGAEPVAPGPKAILNL